MFYTPRGLKIRLPIPYAFTLLSRLVPHRTPEAVLRTVEGIEMIPTFVWELALVMAWLADARWDIALASGLGARLLAVVLLQMGLFIIPGLPSIALMYSYIPSLVRWLGIAVLGYFIAGWFGPAIWVVLVVSGGMVQIGLEFVFGKSRHTRSGGGMVITASELFFLHAFRLHASSLEANSDLGVSDEEIDSGEWQVAAFHYASAFPDRLNLN